jgi:D-lactate dehydrogenase
MIFATIEDACRTVFLLKQTPVSAVELMDRAALRSVENKKGLPDFLKTLPDAATALLVETRAADEDELQRNVDAIIHLWKGSSAPQRERTPSANGRPLPRPNARRPCCRFNLPMWWRNTPSCGTSAKGFFRPWVRSVKSEPRSSSKTWPFPSSTWPPPHWSCRSCSKYDYHEAIIFGHALEGNLHFVFTPDFSDPAQIERYRLFMDDICHMVVDRYDGSLKAEHGTGRNMAPYVEMEWGNAAYKLMEEIKSIFDPKRLLNPGVILSDNPIPTSRISNPCRRPTIFWINASNADSARRSVPPGI